MRDTGAARNSITPPDGRSRSGVEFPRTETKVKCAAINGSTPAGRDSSDAIIVRQASHDVVLHPLVVAAGADHVTSPSEAHGPHPRRNSRHARLAPRGPGSRIPRPRHRG